MGGKSITNRKLMTSKHKEAMKGWTGGYKGAQRWGEVRGRESIKIILS